MFACSICSKSLITIISSAGTISNPGDAEKRGLPGSLKNVSRSAHLEKPRTTPSERLGPQDDQRLGYLAR